MKIPPLEVSFQDESRYLLVTARGKFETLAISEALRQIRAKAQQTQHSRILIDAYNLSLPETDFDRFLVGQLFAEQLPVPLKVAVVYKQEWITKFTENTAVNRGATLFVCGDKAEALRWLLEVPCNQTMRNDKQ